MHHRHHVDAHAVGKVRTKVAGVTALEYLTAERRNVHWLRLKVGERSAQALKVFFVRIYGQIDVAAEVGGPVQDARLPAHQQGADTVLPDRRKDSEGRVRAQANLPARGTFPRACRTPPSAAPA